MMSRSLISIRTGGSGVGPANSDVVQAAVVAEGEGAAAGVGGCLIQLRPSIALKSYED